MQSSLIITLKLISVKRTFLFLIACVFAINLCLADEVITEKAATSSHHFGMKWADKIQWYRLDDPLNTAQDTPSALPDGYRDTSTNNPCETPTNPNKALTLADVADASLCNNPQTRAAWASARFQAAQLGIAKSAYYPVVTDNISLNANVANPQGNRTNPYSNLSNNLVASYLLYDFGNRDANLENARQLLQAASATQSSIVQNVLLNSVQAYYQVQAQQAALEAAIESEKASNESFKSAEARYKAGVSTPADKLQAQTAYAQLTLARISSEGALKIADGALANVMGLEANQPLTLATPKPIDLTNQVLDDVNALIEQARSRRPDLMASEAQAKAAEASINASISAAKPTLSLAFSNNTQDGSQLRANNNAALGFTVNIPIFQGYAPTYKIRAAQANADVQTAQLARLKLQVSLDVWNNYQNLKTATQSMTAAEVLVQSATESSRVASGRYKAGVGNIIEQLNAQSALATAKLQSIQASLNFNIARAALAQAIGILDNAMIQSLPNN